MPRAEAEMSCPVSEFLGWKHWADEAPTKDIPIKVYRKGWPQMVRTRDLHPDMNINGLYWKYDPEAFDG
jgi:DNA polymerase IIIc chi subunit